LDRVNYLTARLLPWAKFGASCSSTITPHACCRASSRASRCNSCTGSRTHLRLIPVHLCRRHREEENAPDFGITYDHRHRRVKTIDELGELGVTVRAVVITRFDNQPSAVAFKEQARTPGHPGLHPRSDQRLSHRRGHDRQRGGVWGQPLHRNRAPNCGRDRTRAGSGKLATCLSQLYHEPDGCEVRTSQVRTSTSAFVLMVQLRQASRELAAARPGPVTTTIGRSVSM